MLFPHCLLHPCQEVRNVQMLRTLRQTLATGDARRCRVAALHGRHRDGVVRHRPFFIFVQDIVVVHVGEDVADGDIVRTGDALVTARAAARLISFRWDGTDSSPNKHTETHSRKATLTGLTSISILPRRSVRAHFWHLPLTRATFRSRGRRPRSLGSSGQGLQERPRRVWS